MNIELEEHTTEYYIAVVEEDLYDWIFQTNDGAIGREPWASIDSWCEEVFGEQGAWGGPAGQWKRMGPKYFFATEEERVMFKLRWS